MKGKYVYKIFKKLKTMKWNYHPDIKVYQCGACGVVNNKPTNYCPNCGAKSSGVITV